MLYFQSIDAKKFLTEYWQKKPLVIRQALPNFINPLSPDELAGLAMDDNIESRMVFETPGKAPCWQLKRGPFIEADFTTLPKTHWTLLVQAVDQIIPDVASVLDHFDFIPQWRIDDVMISYAVKHGSVGPHYDNYDVFLYQASGQRKWSLTTKNCNTKNYLTDVELRIMAEFEVEEEYILQAGDMLYLPPHVGHHGVSLDDECMTYSFGYRSYQGQELWDSLGDYLSEHQTLTPLYLDPNWSTLKATSALPREAWLSAKHVLQKMLDDDAMLQSWFGCFATRLDQQAEQHMPLPLEEEDWGDRAAFIEALQESSGLLRDATCRMAYTDDECFINGCVWHTVGVSPELFQLIANQRQVSLAELEPWIQQESNQQLLYDLWKLQWLQLGDV